MTRLLRSYKFHLYFTLTCLRLKDFVVVVVFFSCLLLCVGSYGFYL
uniref:Uncharacterized protein n=1 Tax=Arundo donax TaxID=35708 RepID=A0A0A9FA92_ARUDO